jgi:hypothetical protein
MDADVYINLTETGGISSSVKARGPMLVQMSLSDGATFGSAVVGYEWSFDSETWVRPSIQPLIDGEHLGTMDIVPQSNCRIRLFVITSDPAADEQCGAFIRGRS